MNLRTLKNKKRNSNNRHSIMPAHFLQLIEQRVIAHPAKSAINDYNTTYSYQQLWDEVMCLRKLLKALSVKRLAVALSNCPAWIALDLAAAMEQIVFVPVPHFFSTTQVQHLIKDAQIDHIICAANSSTRLKMSNETQQKQALSSLGCDLLISAFNRDAKNHAAAIENKLPAHLKISYTSGTTGEPKGVLICAQAIDQTVNALLQTIGTARAKRHLSALPFSLLLENVVGIYAVLASGGCCVVPTFDSLGMTGSSTVDWQKFTSVVKTVQPASMITVPALLQGLIYCAEQLELKTHCLEFIAVGGAPISSNLLHQAQQIGLPIFQGYGMTECGSVVCLNTPQSNKIGSVGKPLPHLRVHINEQGEIIIKGTHFMGYTQQNPNVKNSDNEWKTGDLGHFDDQGFLYVTARKSSTFSTAYGRNVAPEWVESELDSETFIAQSIVFGEGQKHNISVLFPIVPQISDAQLTQSVESANQRLPDYAQIGAWTRAKSAFEPTNQQRSASGALQRKVIYSSYQNEIEQLFKQTQP